MSAFPTAARRSGRTTLLALIVTGALAIVGFAAGYLVRPLPKNTSEAMLVEQMKQALASYHGLSETPSSVSEQAGSSHTAVVNAEAPDPNASINVAGAVHEHAASPYRNASSREKAAVGNQLADPQPTAAHQRLSIEKQAHHPDDPAAFVELERRAVPASAAITTEHRFPLTKADINEQTEAPALAVDGKRVYLAWVSETGPEQRTLLWSQSADGGVTFAEPRVLLTTGVHTAVSESRGRTVARRLRTMPHVACQAGIVYLAWVDGGPTVDSVVMRLIQSHDGGQTFSEPIAVHQSLAARPTYTGLHVAPDGTVVCSWLDHRNRVQQPFASMRKPGQEQFEPELMVYSGPDGRGICPCCPTQPWLSPNGDLLVAFRGNEADYRDIWLGRLPAGGAEFTQPQPVIPPTWQFQGCPHDGPTVGLSQRTLHLAWMDARTGIERVYYQHAAADTLHFPAEATSFPGTPDPPSSDTLLRLPPSPGTRSQTHPYLVVEGERVQLVWDENLSAALADDGNASPPSPDRSANRQAVMSREGVIPAVTSSTASQQSGSGTGGLPHAANEAVPGEAPVKARSNSPHESVTGRVVMYTQSLDGGQTFTTPRAVHAQPGVFQTRPKLALAGDGTTYVAWMELAQHGKTLVVARLREGLSP